MRSTASWGLEHFTAIARSVYAVAREQDSDRVLFVPAKSNLGRAEIKGLAFRVVERTTASTIKAPAIAWEPGEVNETADEIFAPANSPDEGRGALAEAEAFLTENLRDGPVESEILSRDADQVGILEHPQTGEAFLRCEGWDFLNLARGANGFAVSHQLRRSKLPKGVKHSNGPLSEI